MAQAFQLKLLHGEGANPRIFGMVCKAVVQTVSLFGCESWTVTDAVWTALKGFHHRAAGRMADMMAHRGPWQAVAGFALLLRRRLRRLVCVPWSTMSPKGNNAQWTASPQDLSGCIAWRRGSSLGPLPRLFVGGIRREDRRRLLTSTGRIELLVCEDIEFPSSPLAWFWARALNLASILEVKTAAALAALHPLPPFELAALVLVASEATPDSNRKTTRIVQE